MWLTVKISNVYDLSISSFYFNFANKKEKDIKQNKSSFFQVKMETKRIIKELKYLLDDDGKEGRSIGVERNSEVVITNRFHQSNLSSEIKTSESSISNLRNSSLMLSESSQVSKDDKNNSKSLQVFETSLKDSTSVGNKQSLRSEKNR